MTEYILLKTSGAPVNPVADEATHATIIVDYPHHELHGGSAYFLIYSALADDTDVIEIRFQTPNTTKWAHMLIDVECALAATVEMWEGTTKTHEAGNVLTALNRNRNSTNTSGLTICHTPGGAQAGAGTITEYVGAATVSGRVAAGGHSGGRNELILDQNNDYLIRVTSRADANALTIVLDWYEHTNKS